VRIIAACIGLLTIGAIVPSGQAQTEPSSAAIQVERLASNLYVLRGGGENAAVLITADGVVLVDGKNPGWGGALLEKVRELTPKPITIVINTHVHHTPTNVELPGSLAVIAHENTARLMREGNPVIGTNVGPPSWSVYKTNNGRGLPTQTFRDRTIIGTGANRVELHYFGRGHTSGDAFVVFPSARVLHAGDSFSFKTLAVIDANNGGSGIGYPEVLAKAATLPNIDRVIPGHAPSTFTMADLREHAEFVRRFVEDVAAAKRSGATVDDVVRTWKVPARFNGYTQPPTERLRVNVNGLWAELKY
jgi:cyclase